MCGFALVRRSVKADDLVVFRLKRSLDLLNAARHELSIVLAGTQSL